MQNQIPSLFRVIATDYSSFLSALFPAVFGVFAVYFFFTKNDALQLFLILAIGAAILGIPFLIKRYKTISSVFEDGADIKGVVTHLSFFRGRGSVGYSYTFQGQKHTTSNAINKNGRTRKLRVGQTVTVIIDRNDPKRAFIREIYL